MNKYSKHEKREGLPSVRQLGWIPTLMLIVGMATAWAWVKPTTRDSVLPQEQTVTYQFDYSADAADAQSVYRDGVVHFGDPVYLKVVHAVDVAIDAKFDMPGAVTTDGAQLVQVLLTSDAGWSRPLSDTGWRTFDGNEVSRTVEVDFASALETAKRAAALTGVQGKLSVTVVASVRANVFTLGDVVGAPNRASLTVASIEFGLTDKSATLRGHQQLSPLDIVQAIENGDAVASSQTAAGESSLQDLATQAVTERVDTVHTTDETVSIGKWDVEVRPLRLVLLAVLAVLAVLSLYEFLVLSIARRRGESVFLDTRYGAGVLDLRHVPDGVQAEAVWVGSFEVLGAMAADTNSDILHFSRAEGDQYFVFDGPRVFAYQAAPNAPRHGRRDHDKEKTS